MRSLLLTAVFISTLASWHYADDTSYRLPKDVPSPLMSPFDAAQAKVSQEAWAKRLGKSSPLDKNAIGMELVLIPPGKFTMGSPSSVKHRGRDEDPVDVTLTSGFYLGKTEVTQGQWRSVMGTTPWKGHDFIKERDDCPATYVSWDDAQAFCRKLSQQEDRKYRLPTEAEWEYACRGGQTTRFYFGDDDSGLSEYAWWGGLEGDGNAKKEKYAHEVGRKLANAFGLHDMHGNVWEWCQDLVRSSPDGHTDKLPGGSDPLVSNAGPGSGRVFRGGAWCDAAARCRSAIRDREWPESWYGIIGFRVARSFDR